MKYEPLNWKLPLMWHVAVSLMNISSRKSRDRMCSVMHQELSRLTNALHVCYYTMAQRCVCHHSVTTIFVTPPRQNERPLQVVGHICID